MLNRIKMLGVVFGILVAVEIFFLMRFFPGPAGPVEKKSPDIVTESPAPPAAKSIDSEDAAVAETVAAPSDIVPAPQPKVPETVIEGRIDHEPVYNELVSCGLAPAQVLSLTGSFEKLFDFRNARPNDRYRIFLDPEQHLRRFVYQTGDLTAYVAEKNEDGGFDVTRKEMPLESRVCARTFTIETSLYQAVLDGGENSRLASRFADIFAWDIDFYLYPRKGDTITVLFEKCFRKDRFIKYGDILAAEYNGQRQTFTAFRFNDGKTAGYYDESGRPLRKMFLRIPVKFGHKTSSFSIRRFHPVTKKYKRHTGIDYGARHGTPIFATASGRVVFAGWKNGYGKLVIVKHPNGYQTYYGHCSKLIAAKGQTVEQGQVIARVGQTGLATGPHVHYEVRVNGKPINPNRVKKTSGRPIPEALAAKFMETVAGRRAMTDAMLGESAAPALAGQP